MPYMRESRKLLERERERERDRQTDRQRERERETDRQTEKGGRGPARFSFFLHRGEGV